jgi:hypothetical protein
MPIKPHPMQHQPDKGETFPRISASAAVHVSSLDACQCHDIKCPDIATGLQKRINGRDSLPRAIVSVRERESE